MSSDEEMKHTYHLNHGVNSALEAMESKWRTRGAL